MDVTKLEIPGKEGALDPSKPCNEMMDAVKDRFEPLMPAYDLNDHAGTEKDNYELLMLTQLNNEIANKGTRFNVQALTFNTMNYHKDSDNDGGKIKTQKYSSEPDQYLEFTDIEQRQIDSSNKDFYQPASGLQGIGPTNYIGKKYEYRNMFTYFTEKKSSKYTIPRGNYVSALYSCEESITPIKGDPFNNYEL